MVSPLFGVGLLMAYVLTACGSKKSDKPIEGPSKQDPEFELYQKLKEAGVSPEEMDQGIEKHPELNPNRPYTGRETLPFGYRRPEARDGKIDADELVAVALDRYSGDRDNKKFKDIVQVTLPRLAKSYFNISERVRNDNVERQGMDVACPQDPFVHRISMLDPTFVPALRWEGFCAPEPNQALSIYKKMQRLSPLDPSAHLGEGEALYLLGKTEEALKALGKALILDERQARAHYLSALVQFNLKAPDAMVRALQESVKADEKFLRGWFFLGLALEAKGDAPGAKEAISQALALQNRPQEIPDIFFDFIVRQHLVLDENTKTDFPAKWPGNITLYRDRLNDLSSASMDRMQKDPNDPKAHLAVAVTRMFGGPEDRALAIGYLRKAIELDPQCRDAHYLLAITLVQKGEFEAAHDLLRAPVLLSPNNKPLTNAFVEFVSNAKFKK